MLCSEVITIVRTELGDTFLGNERWPDSELFGYLGHAQTEAQKVRPDLYLDDDGELVAPVTPAALDTVLTGDATLARPLAYHVCYQALSPDGADEANMKRAGEYFGRYLQTLVGGVAGG